MLRGRCHLHLGIGEIADGLGARLHLCGGLSLLGGLSGSLPLLSNLFFRLEPARRHSSPLGHVAGNLIFVEVVVELRLDRAERGEQFEGTAKAGNLDLLPSLLDRRLKAEGHLAVLKSLGARRKRPCPLHDAKDALDRMAAVVSLKATKHGTDRPDELFLALK